MARLYFTRVIGVEPSKIAARVLQEKNIDYINDYFSKDYFQNQKVDAFYCSMVFEHLENPLQVLTDIFDILADGAAGSILVPNGWDIIQKKLVRHLQLEHINYYSAASLFKLAINAGFSVVSVDIPDESNLFIVVKKECSYPDSFAMRKRQIGDFCTALPKDKRISAYGASVRTALVMRLVEEHVNIANWYDSSTDVSGKYLPGCKTVISTPSEKEICENDIILLFGTAYDEEISEALRTRYKYKGEILTIP